MTLPSTSTCLHLKQDANHTSRLSTGCSNLDSLLQGGLCCHGITEVCGEASVGKTQFLLRLLLTAQLPLSKGGLDGCAVYICTEGAACSKRLGQIAEEFVRRNYLLCSPCSLLDKVYISQVHDLEAFYDLLQYSLHRLLGSRKVKLVVVDSITALFRVEFGRSASELKERTLWLTSIAAIMRKLSHEFGAAFVVANQVTADFNASARFALKPALGLTWSNCVNTRLRLHKEVGMKAPNDDEKQQAQAERRLFVEFSPIHGNMSCYYTICKAGVIGKLT